MRLSIHNGPIYPRFSGELFYFVSVDSIVVDGCEGGVVEWNLTRQRPTLHPNFTASRAW